VQLLGQIEMRDGKTLSARCRPILRIGREPVAPAIESKLRTYAAMLSSAMSTLVSAVIRLEGSGLGAQLMALLRSTRDRGELPAPSSTAPDERWFRIVEREEWAVRNSTAVFPSRSDKVCCLIHPCRTVRGRSRIPLPESDLRIAPVRHRGSMPIIRWRRTVFWERRLRCGVPAGLQCPRGVRCSGRASDYTRADLEAALDIVSGRTTVFSTLWAKAREARRRCLRSGRVGAALVVHDARPDVKTSRT